ncbi:hypothetical protein J5288_08705 [Agrobacterium sp. S2/73]|uniref:hypothetical protein n=1 Tax=unclassified Agrobacterium TaxID=2632611 RepID=UPI001ADAC0CA|nr:MULTISPECIES: hypothetical protein [unclassified Agrobacterium]MBO9108782.1 hypothetical protein [Agrobacterium sp. S2/73]QXZ73461.1 hypothetical protein J5276_05805 [Agrobacterium sp. S7/73]
MSTKLIQELHAAISRRDWAATELVASRLRDEIEELRKFMAGSDISSLPNDFPLRQLAAKAISKAKDETRADCARRALSSAVYHYDASRADGRS